MQGTWSALGSFTEANRGRLGARVAKTLTNNLLLGALSYAACAMTGDDDDREWYLNLADSIKTNYLIFPAGEDSPRQFIRLPAAQNPFARLAQAAGTQIMSMGNGDGVTLDLLSMVTGILGDSIQTDTIASPWLAAFSNKSWTGDEIVPSYLEGSESQKYVASTPELFKQMARGLSLLGIEVSPMIIQYMIQQQTGFIGQIAIPSLSGDKYSGYKSATSAMDVLKAAARVFRNSWTISGAYTNDIQDLYYGGYQKLNDIVDDVKSTGYSDRFRADLSPEEAQKALDQARLYTSGKGSVIGEVRANISELKKESNAILDRDDLTPTQKEKLCEDIQKEIVREEQRAVDEMNAYFDMYCNHNGLVEYLKFINEGGAKAVYKKKQ